jgi:4-amino-4-deoxy-L-arabinose transferase-like glycosyltransferase
VLLALMGVSLVVGREVFNRLILPAPPLNFDEAAHSLPGYYMLRDARNLDLRAFWGDFHIQTLWPPMFSILQAPFLGLLGLTDDAARLFAYIMLVGAVLLGGWVLYEIAPERAPVATWVSGLIALTAPGWLFTGSWAMQETPVAFVSMLVFGCFLRARNTGRLRWYTLTGLSLLVFFLTKYNYAAFALASVGLVDLLVRLGVGQRPQALTGSITKQLASGQRMLSRFQPAGFLALHVPWLVGVLFWFFAGTDIVPTSVKWRDFAFFVTNENTGLDFWSADNLLFYIRAAGDWLLAHPLWLVVIVLLAVVALTRTRHPGIALLGLYFAFGFILATLHPLKSNRYVTPVFPALWLLSGLGAAIVAERFRSRVLVVLIPLAAAAAIFANITPQMQPVWAGAMARDMRIASEQIVAWQDGARPVLIIGTFGEMSPPLFEWRLRPLPAFADNPAIQYDAPPVEGPDDVARVQRWLNENPGAQVTLIRLDEASPAYQTRDMRDKNAWRQVIVRRFDEVTGYRKVDERRFVESGLTISYWVAR